MIDLSFLNLIVQEFVKFVEETFISLLTVPPSLSMTAAITLTFAWLYSEFASLVRIMRGLVAAAWALTIGNSFFGVGFTTTIGFWLLVGIVVALNLVWVLLRRRASLTCSNCGNNSRFKIVVNMKTKSAEVGTVSCADCGSSEVTRTGSALRLR